MMGDVLCHGQFYGETKRRSKIGGFSLAETIYPPRLRIPRHSHEDAYFCLILRGSYTETYGSKTRGCSAFTLAFHPQAEVHAEDFDDCEVCSFNVGIQSSCMDHIREHSQVLDRSAHLQGGTAGMLAMRLYSEFWHMDEVSPLAIEGLVLELVAEASRRTVSRFRRKSERWLGQVKDVLHARLAENISLDEIANEVGFHPAHVAREFRRSFQCTIGEYVRQLRVEGACRSLVETDMPLMEIALGAGFFDQSHFCRVFRELTGTTPREYRSAMVRQKG
jgi:AraC family transcriptional regulator